jgi:nucleotide-binding universal stress UspA family protein
VLVHVVPWLSAPASWVVSATAAIERRESDAHRQMCAAMAPLKQVGPVESVIVQGNIADRVAELAQTSHAGLIVMGLDPDPRGSHPGSTAYAVISRAPIPVLAIPTCEKDGA